MKKILFPALLLFLLLACNVMTSTSPLQTEEHSQHSIGFDFSGHEPSIATGDMSAPTHLFVHKYPFPSDGFVTSVTLLNDSDDWPEPFTLLILRPIVGGWKVIHRVNIGEDDQPSANTGLTTIYFGTPLEIKKGDMFAHWQFGGTGPIPLNDDTSSIDGLSFGKFGLSSADIEEGQVLSNQGYSGGRDYFINLSFEATP
jgi:hypothetical protein